MNQFTIKKNPSTSALFLCYSTCCINIYFFFERLKTKKKNILFNILSTHSHILPKKTIFIQFFFKEFFVTKTLIDNLSACFEHFVPGKRECNLWKNRGRSNISWVFRLHKSTLFHFRVSNPWIGDSYVYCIVYDTRSIIVLTCGCQTLTILVK